MPLIKLPQLVVDNPFPAPQIPERMVWTSSSVALFKACKRKWFWKYIMGLRQKSNSPALVIGKAFHATLGEWYKGRRANMQQIADRVAEKLELTIAEDGGYYDQDDLDKAVTVVRTFRGMMQGYAEIYENDRDKWNIRRDLIEAIFMVDMGPFDYSGRIDLVASKAKNAKYFQVEHKTASMIDSSYIDRLALDTQTRGYVLGCREGLGIDVSHIVYDVVKKCKLRKKSGENQDNFNQRIADDYLARPDFYFHREPLTFSRADLECLKWELNQVHVEFINLTSRTEYPAQKMAEAIGIDWKNPLDARMWAPNDKNCSAFFRTCEYHALCVRGLDRGSASQYRYEEAANEELVDTE